MKHGPTKSSASSLWAAALLREHHALLIGAAGTQAVADGKAADYGAVYTMTNSTTGNAVVVYARAADGTLTMAGIFPTGDTSIGVFATGNQNGLLLSNDARPPMGGELFQQFDFCVRGEGHEPEPYQSGRFGWPATNSRIQPAKLHGGVGPTFSPKLWLVREIRIDYRL